MNILDTRARDALILLLREPGPLTISAVAARLRITPRMLRSSLEGVEHWLREEHIPLERKPNVGVWIDAGPEARQRLLSRLEEAPGYQLHLTTAERQMMLTFLLLSNAGEPTQAAHLEAALGISRPTLLKDLNQAEAWLREHHLGLARRARPGFLVTGAETDIREALVSFLLDHLDRMHLLALFNSPSGARDLRRHVSLNRVQEMLVDHLQKMELDFAASQVVRLEKGLNRRFTDDSFVELVCHLALMAERVRRGFGAPEPPRAAVIEHASDPACIRQAVVEMGLHFDLALGEGEKLTWARQVSGAKLRYSVADLMRALPEAPLRVEVSELVSEIVEDASLYLHPYLKVDQQLIRGLSYHIEVALSRLRNHLPIRNPLLAAIQEQYPQIYRIAAHCAAAVSRQTGEPVPDEEIGYLAMHLGAAMERLRPFLGLRRRLWIICSEGVATAWMLVSRLRAELPDIEVVEVTSAVEVGRQPPRPGEVDLILSTIPVELSGFEVLLVSPLLTAHDLERVREALEMGPNHAAPVVRPAPDEHILSLTDLVPRAHIRLKVNAHSWEEVVEKAGAPLLAEGAIEARYVAAMKAVIREYGPYMVFAPGVALLHARPENGVNRLCLSLVTLQTAVAFGHPHNDPVSLAIVLGVVDHKSHLRALSELAEHVSDPAWVSRVKAAGSPAEILRLLASAHPGLS